MGETFGWTGATRGERVRVLVADDVRAWLSAWSRSPSTVIAEAFGEEDVFPSALFSSGEVAVGCDATMAELGASMAGIADADNPLAAHLGERALEDLLIRISGAAGAGETTSWDGLPGALRETRLGAVHLIVRLPQGEIVIALGRRQVDRRVPVVARERRLPLTTRRSAIDGSTATLRVELDLGEVTLGDARALSPGDVLVTQVPLTKWADIFIDAQAQPTLRGRPGRADGHRAVAIEHLEERNPTHE